MDNIQVEIFGQKYSLKGGADADYVRGLAALVDARMRDVQKGTGTADGYRIAILAALSLADELLRVRSDHESFLRTAEGSLVRLIDLTHDNSVP
jgi:cell division protein ZapA